MGQSGGRSQAIAIHRRATTAVALLRLGWCLAQSGWSFTLSYTTPMTHERRFEELLAELERIGVDPQQFPAGLEISAEAAMRVLAQLPDGVGPAAFLAGLRAAMSSEADVVE
jgi:hypothetical protein